MLSKIGLDLGGHFKVPILALGIVGCSLADSSQAAAEQAAEEQAAREQVSQSPAAFLLSVPPTELIRGLSLAVLEEASGMDVFVAGPHNDGAFDFSSTSDFGHYNPEFLSWVIDTLLDDGWSAETSRWLSQRLGLFPAFRSRMFSLSAARCAIQVTPDSFDQFKEEYRNAMEAGRAFSAYGAFAKWSDYGAGYNAEDLAFWARRDSDGTTPIVLEGLRRALQRFYFSTYQRMVRCLSEAEPGAPLPTFFAPESFLDHETWGDPSALECREELIRQHYYGTSSPQADSTGAALFDDRGAILEVLTNAGCPETLITGPHYGLIPDEDEVRWEPLELDISLEFYRPDVLCGSNRLVALRVEPAEPLQPILFRTGNPTSNLGYIRITEERDDPQSSTTHLVFADTPLLASVYKTHQRSTFLGDSELAETVISMTTLWAEFNDGRTTKIEERHGVGKYTYSEPAIENIVILDVNGDNQPDFLYDIDNLGRNLVITRDGEILRVIQLVTDEYSGVGGC